MANNIEILSISLPVDIEKSKQAGDYAKARNLIQLYHDDPKTPAFLKDRLQMEREILDRLERCYPYTEEEGLQLIQKEIPDFSMNELRNWEARKGADWIYRNGSVYLQKRFFASMKKVYPEIGKRAGEPINKNTRLDGFIADIKAKGTISARVQMETTVSIPDDAFHPGQVLVHIPIPRKDISCTNIVVEETNTPPCYTAPENAPQRTIAFRENMTLNHPFRVRYSYDIQATYKPLQEQSIWCDKHDTQEQAPSILFTPLIRELCRELTGSETNPLKIARRFYNYCTQNVIYSYMPDYWVLGNISEYAAGQRIGDCGVQALLFITLCRCAGIPARWQSGKYISADGSVGNHDWALFEIQPYGWLFADPSFGGSAWRAGAVERWNYYFGNLDIYRMPANSELQREFFPVKQGYRNDPYDNQNGEIERDGKGIRDLESTTKLLSIEVQ